MITATQVDDSEYVSVGCKAGKMTKVERYGWILRDRPGEFMLIEKNELRVDYEYQRDRIAIGKVREIQSNWSWAGCGCILVAMRADGSFWVFDGQHRVIAARSRADITTLPCLVFEVENKAQEAAGFIVSNTQRKPIPATAKFRAMVMAGDPVAVAVDSMLCRLGMSVSASANSRRELKCVATCLKYAATSLPSLEKAIAAINLLEGNESPQSHVIDGLVWLDRKFGVLSDARFLKKFVTLSREEIESSTQRFAIVHGNRGDKVNGEAILHLVNKNLRNKFGDKDE